ncbi:MAG TPA: hypothetical protein VFL97_08980 [Nitrococcus sp.]|nr:hypothetical protein [Nitrococcus sp.]
MAAAEAAQWLDIVSVTERPMTKFTARRLLRRFADCQFRPVAALGPRYVE